MQDLENMDAAATERNYSSVGLEDLRADLTDLVSRAAYVGERFLITRNGKPIAALVPASDLDRLNGNGAA